MCTISKIHWEMAKYHEAGRFSEDLAPDMESALYHLKKAARGGVTDALYTLAHIHLQQPHDDFKEISMEVSVFLSLSLSLSLSLFLQVSCQAWTCSYMYMNS